METENRTAFDRLALLQALAAAPHHYSFYQAVRLLECAHPEVPRVGTSQRLRDDAFRIGQEPHLDFAPATVSSFHPAAGRAGVPKLLIRFQGLTGPNGPLPLHLTEYARERQLNAGDHTLVHFFDVFNHRLLSMFYRAWADAQPTVSMDRADHDSFSRWISSLAGYGMKPLRQRDTVPDTAKQAAAGLLSRSVRNADGLMRLLASYFGVTVQIVEWHPQWLPLAKDTQTRIGRDQPNAQLGKTAVIGCRVWDCQSNFLIVLGPLLLQQFERFLPGQDSLVRLRDWLLNYCGHELSCSAKLVLRQDQVPVVRLGQQGRLGLTTWLGSRSTMSGDADDLALRVT